MPERRRPAMIALFLIGAALLSALAGISAVSRGVERLSERGAADLALASDRLEGQLLRYRQLAVFLADQSRVKAGLAPPPLRSANLTGLLQRAVDMTGSLDILVIRPDGEILEASDGREGHYPPAPEIRRALTGALGLGHRIEPETGQRLFVYAAPVYSVTGPVLGAVVLRIDAAEVETAWRGETQSIFFTDPGGAIFIAIRDELRLRQTGADPGPAALDPRAVYSFAGQTIWLLNKDGLLPSLALHLSRPMPVIDMTAETLVSVAPALRQGALQGSATAALCLGLGAVLFALSERRRSLAVRLAAEAAANARLEERVAARTEELSQANDRLRRTQAELVQAGKLSALGTMSAGISHELNQPLMAIQTYAGNAGQFLDRGDSAAVGRNLTQISELARRMGRIIRNLRAFARQESAPVTTVDLVSVVEAALELSAAKLRAGGIALDWAPTPGPVLVRGGEVRLQQVVLNLIGNAADAMEGAARRELSLAIDTTGGPVILTVADTGPGIAEPDRIFEPFYSTKEVGQSEGMGLGLSISYGLVQSFGGKITGRNRPEGGAAFSVELTAATEAQAA